MRADRALQRGDPPGGKTGQHQECRGGQDRADDLGADPVACRHQGAKRPQALGRRHDARDDPERSHPARPTELHLQATLITCS